MAPLNLAIFSDNGHDADDIQARKFGQHLHKKGSVKILFEVVQLTLKSEQVTQFNISKKQALNDRAKLTSGDNVATGITNIPVAHGDPETEAMWPYHPSYETYKPLVELGAKHPNLLHLGKKEMETLVAGIFAELKQKKEKLTIIVLTNFQQLEVVRDHIGGALFDEVVSEIHMQNSLPLPATLPKPPAGQGMTFIPPPGFFETAGPPDKMAWEWKHDKSAANTSQHEQSAEKFFAWSKNNKNIQFFVYSKGAAMPVSYPSPKYFESILLGSHAGKAAGGNLGIEQDWFRLVQKNVAWEYFRDSCKNPPIIPNRTKEWYLRVFCGIVGEAEVSKYPMTADDKKNEEMFFSKLYDKVGVVPYDPIAFLGAIRDIKDIGWTKIPFVAVKDQKNKWYLGENIDPKFHKDKAGPTAEAERVRKIILATLKAAFSGIR
ncbi:hypothetical protein K491DRAFT_723462 [Lophiostoma macrostomum CBS 122681]|uniref:Inosine/uridine-preferring nucleoside hydrolase domain-containing protein n=1 Tax=Lophiostoma macrostomum CBS 122681 TaxID=1314788 RepID=A0A6A6SJ29_9PLEO|nr:hypothetical protein K491DRAFT_723462 [Lophiostoma macrostomum CBS 122681]